MRVKGAEGDRLLSAREIEALIAAGRKIIVVDGRVLKVDAWLDFHPGGDKAILHMVGRDATDEVNAFHSFETRQAMESFKIGRIQGRWVNFLPPIQGGKYRHLNEGTSGYFSDLETSDLKNLSFSEEHQCSAQYDFGQVSDSLIDDHLKVHQSSPENFTLKLKDGLLQEYSKPKFSTLDAITQKEIELDLSKYPSVDIKTQQLISQRYRDLDARIRQAGLYQCNYYAYAIEICRYLVLISLALLFLHHEWYGTSGAFLGLFWHQLVFTAHDAGHMGITHNFHVDTVIGIIAADFIGGLSLGWWKRNHNVHHIVTNYPEHDPDIELMPFFAISHRFFDSLFSTYYDRVMVFDTFAKIMIRCQHYLYYPILAFGRFNLYLQSWTFLISGLGPRRGPAWWHRWLEIAGNLFFWIWFGYGITYKSIPTFWGRFAFVMASHLITGPLHVQITLSHFAMSTANLGVQESFPQRMLRTTMDVECPEWLDFFHGGLQFQVAHHLFPRMPRHNFRKAQRLIKEFCAEVGIPYVLLGFVHGNKEVIGRLGEVGRQASMLVRSTPTSKSTRER